MKDLSDSEMDKLREQVGKFTTEGEVVLRVGVTKNEAGGRLLRFEVKDTGIGIAPEAQAGLFQAFVQADTSTTRRFGASSRRSSTESGQPDSPTPCRPSCCR